MASPAGANPEVVVIGAPYVAAAPWHNRSMGRDPLASLREICLSFPETTERLSHGEPTWFVRDKKVFVTYADHHHDDRLGFWCAAPPGAQEEMMSTSPERFFRPPYVGHRGWVGVRIDRVGGSEPDWEEIAEVVREAYRQVAPRRLVARLDEAGPDVH